MPPVALSVHVAKVQAFFESVLDAGSCTGDFAGDERFTTQWAFVVEENTVARKHSIRFAVVHGDPIGVHFCGSVWAARVKWSFFCLRNLLNLAVKLTRARLVKFGFVGEAENADGFKNTQSTDAVGVCCIFRSFKAHLNVALRCEVVDFGWLNLLDDADEVRAVGHVSVVKHKAGIGSVRVLVDMIDTLGVEGARAAFNAVNFVALREQEFREICSVLACNACDEGNFT